MTVHSGAERQRWPASAYASDDAEWVNYLHRAYYLVGMLWAVGRGEQAIAALCKVAPDTSSVPADSGSWPERRS